MALLQITQESFSCIMVCVKLARTGAAAIKVSTPLTPPRGQIRPESAILGSTEGIRGFRGSRVRSNELKDE